MTVEVAMALVLLVGAALMYRTVDRLLLRSRVRSARASSPSACRWSGRPGRKTARCARSRTTAAPRARAARRRAVALAGQIPLGGNYDRWGFRPEDRSYASDADVPSVERYSVTPDYFRVDAHPAPAGAPLHRCRRRRRPAGDGRRRDHGATVWPGENPIGKRVRLSGHKPRDLHGRRRGRRRPPLRAGHARRRRSSTCRSLRSRIRISCSSSERRATRRRSSTNPTGGAAIGRDVPVYDVATLDDRMSHSVALRTFLMLLLVTLAAIAHDARGGGALRRHRPERGGAPARARHPAGARGDACGRCRLVLGAACSWSAPASSRAVAGAATLGRFLSSQLYQTAPTDPLALAIASAALAAVSLVAHIVPLRRATGVDPSTTLRSD